jgi:DNA invertase Pin-like site-specific DNA recombinase
MTAARNGKDSSHGKRIGYVRVSTVDQNTSRQLDGIQVDKVFTDKASGKDTKRPQLQAALDYVREGDTLVVHSMDRLARNLEDLCRIVRELTTEGVAVEFIKESLTFTREGTKPFSQLLLGMLGAVAQFERALLRERQREGIDRAKAEGVYKGRKPSLGEDGVQRLKSLLQTGMSKTEAARQLNISRETLYAYLRADSKKHEVERKGKAPRKRAP